MAVSTVHGLLKIIIMGVCVISYLFSRANKMGRYLQFTYVST